MIRRFILRWLNPRRDLEGKFVTKAHRRDVRRIAKQLRAEMPGRKWKHSI